MTNSEICKREKEDEAAWDAYVYNSPASTFYHQQRSVLVKLFKSLMWRNVVEKTYKHKPIYLVAKEDSEVKGVLPLFLMRSWFFGKKRVPFAPYGGVCADNETVENAIVEKHFFQKEIFSFTKEIFYLLYNEKAKRVTEDCLDIRGRVNSNASIYYRLCKNENGT